ncbi:Uncharacterized membrane protein YeiB [Nocardiopsis flavescens]|uniref:Uncharacterized membrane protein YeiB n=1 Tax=Nocardiopsis flavescens TaxID=758803 RepID=A0A1M6DZH8_9ACTN|nr:DUF418 domain-containing protein [Nocardiopsis flavescens]SHI78674.1 Uncharacterized membrane protein YeiB [Nocardiopsis flavescens]
MVSEAEGRAQGPGAGRPGRRSLAPDLARGFMLLFIALVNAGFFLTGPDAVRDLADRLVVFVQLTLVTGRAVPLFALLFGYGAVMIARRVRASGGGWVQTRILLRRRGWVLLALGGVHGVLLLPVDILGAYGLALLVFVGLVRARDVTLWWTAGVLAAVSAAVHAASVPAAPADGGGGAAVPSLVEPSFAAATVERFHEWILYTPVTMLLVAMPVIAVGIWAGHRRLLEEPAVHRPLLRAAAGWGLGGGVLSGLPDALATAGAFAAGPRLGGALAVLHDLGGWAGGIGWAAVLALFAARWERGSTTAAPAERAPRIARTAVTAVAAVGERSLSCYLWQSLVFTAVFAPYGLGLGASLGAAEAAAVAVGTWLASVAAAEALRRAGRRGPAEVLVRRLVRPREPLVQPC